MSDTAELWKSALEATEERTIETLSTQGENISEDKIARIVLLTFLEELAQQIPDVDQNDLRVLIERVREKHQKGEYTG